MYKYLREYINKEEFQLVLLDKRVNIVNYEILLQITSQEIIVKSKNKKIKLIGNDLAIAKLLDDELLITGDIVNIEVHNG